ncbi:hypothetical protein A4X13_0g5168 [Tilletia indica]|uniref:Uncharacterized protein n=1 Tax=Tilletia indica TaxID=43049 RepID=A0A177TF47_9BASI|nr:hypothetical protein A4X13_0g5168 [Tilletia indica]
MASPMEISEPPTPNGHLDHSGSEKKLRSGFVTDPQTPATPGEWVAETPKTRLGQAVRTSLNALETRLNDLVEGGTSTSWSSNLARRLHGSGAWIQHALKEEYEMRVNAMSGLDQMWILLSPPELGGPPTSNQTLSQSGKSPRKGFSFIPTCTALYTFEGDEPVGYDAVKEALTRQADAFPRYKSVITNANRRFHAAAFVEDPNWDVERHIETVELPDGAGQEALEEFIASFIARPWDFSKPLWECVIVTNFYSEKSAASSALVTRGHHTLADGQGFIASQLLTTSFGPELRAKLEDGQKLLRDARRGRAKPSKLHQSLKPLDRYRHYVVVQILMLLAFWTVWALTQFLELTGSLRQAFVTGTYFLLTAWRQQYLTSEYDGPRVSEKEFSVSPHFPLSDVKKIQRAFSGAKPGSWLDRAAKKGNAKNKTPYKHLTLNDVLCTVIADVLAKEAHHQEPSHSARRKISHWLKTASHYILPSPIALFIPISIRPLQVDPKMENWSTGSIAYLPSPLHLDGSLKGEEDVTGLYDVLHRNADALKVVKRGWIPAVFFYSIQMTGQIPWLYPAQMWDFWPMRPIMRLCVDLCLSSFQAVLTNVPGPSDHVQLADREVSEWGAAPPQAGKNTLAIGVITYGGAVSVTFTADRVKDEPSEGVARRLADAFAERWEVYQRAAGAVLGEE